MPSPPSSTHRRVSAVAATGGGGGGGGGGASAAAATTTNNNVNSTARNSNKKSNTVASLVGGGGGLLRKSLSNKDDFDNFSPPIMTKGHANLPRKRLLSLQLRYFRLSSRFLLLIILFFSILTLIVPVILHLLMGQSKAQQESSPIPETNGNNYHNNKARAAKSVSGNSVVAKTTSMTSAKPIELIKLEPMEVDMDYGTEVDVGYSIFEDTPTCRSLVYHQQSTATTTTSTSTSCIMYHPLVDLQNYLPNELFYNTDDNDGQPLLLFQQHHSVDDGIMNRQRQQQQQPKNSGAHVKVLGDMVPYNLDMANHHKNDHVAVLTRRGYGIGHEFNQDRVLIVSPYHVFGVKADAAATSTAAKVVENRGGDDTKNTPATMTRTIGRNVDFVMGVFDGHGETGHVISQYTVAELPRLLASKLQHSFSANNPSSVSSSSFGIRGKQNTNTDDYPDEEIVKKALIETFLEIDETVPPDHSLSGCTASVVLKLSTKLYFANAGDSQSFLVTYQRSPKKVDIVYITRQDKPHLPEERSRIESKGGKISLPPPWSKGDSSRVVIEVDGIGSMLGLAMSRSIGDRSLTKYGVIANPIVDVVDLNKIWSDDNEKGRDVKAFVISATDGLYDRVSPEEMAQRIAYILYEKEVNVASSSSASVPPLLEECEGLIMDASAKWIKELAVYRDDISIAVHEINR